MSRRRGQRWLCAPRDPELLRTMLARCPARVSIRHTATWCGRTRALGRLAVREREEPTCPACLDALARDAAERLVAS